MDHTIFSTDHTLVEIVKSRATGTMSEIWHWEVTIAVNQLTYKGKAVEVSRNAVIGWGELASDQPLNEMIERCKYYMSR